MKILRRNTVFKTAVLTGLFSCMLMLAGAFSGITTSVHAMHAEDVETEQNLKEFVEEAVEFYYIDSIIKTELCDFGKLFEGKMLPVSLAVALPILGFNIPDPFS